MMLMFRSAARVIVALAATAALAQSAQPGTTPSAPILNQRPGLAGRRGPAQNKTADPQGLVAMRERVVDMESTVSQMRVVLKQMQANATKSKATDSLTKANLHMWELMVGHLDKDLQQLRATLTAREDFEARRASLYRQADVKAEAEAQAARAAMAARFAQAQQNAAGTPTPAPTEQPAGQSAEKSSATQTAPAQPSTLPPDNNTASPHLP